MIAEKLTLLIHSCNKFSDLWEAHVNLLNKNWADRNIETFILTDEPSNAQFENVKILSAGAGKEMTERIRYALPRIKTEYVLVTLDDYFLTEPISTERIKRLVEIMEREGYDYIRMFDRPRCPKTPTSDDGIYTFDLTGNYRVNLYSGIWRKDFIEKTLGDKVLNAWQFEVTLTESARKVNGKCAVSEGTEFPILDVVRKGRILPNAWRYLKKHNLYHGARPMMQISAYTWLGIKTWSNRLLAKLPSSWYSSIRSLFVKLGGKSYSSAQ